MVYTKKIIPNYRVLHVNKNTLYAAKNYSIYKSNNAGEHWTLDGRVVDHKYRFLGSVNKLLARLLRIEVSDLVILKDGTRIIIAKKGIFVAKPNNKQYIKVFSIPRGVKPMNICVDNNENIYFGEYISNGSFAGVERDEVHIYRSTNKGKDWNVCHTFPKNTIRHIHGIFYDAFTNKVWFTTGDRGDECIIGNTPDGFKTINIVKQGGQKYRAVKLLFYKDFIIYGTDTQVEQNYIIRFDRNDGKEYIIQEVQGSVLSATNFGNYACIATAIEPSDVNTDPYSHLWFSKDGLIWKDIYKAKKDSFSPKYFQFGRMLFPHNAIMNDQVIVTGHALEGIDNKTLFHPLSAK